MRGRDPKEPDGFRFQKEVVDEANVPDDLASSQREAVNLLAKAVLLKGLVQLLEESTDPAERQMLERLLKAVGENGASGPRPEREDSLGIALDTPTDSV